MKQLILSLMILRNTLLIIRNINDFLIYTKNEIINIINLPEISEGYLLNESFNTTLHNDSYYLILKNFVNWTDSMLSALTYYGFVEADDILIDLQKFGVTL